MALPGQEETDDQKRAREMVVECLSTSCMFKLMHGLVKDEMFTTVGQRWAENPGADDAPGTYASVLRYGCVFIQQTRGIPERVMFPSKQGH